MSKTGSRAWSLAGCQGLKISLTQKLSSSVFGVERETSALGSGAGPLLTVSPFSPHVIGQRALL